MRYHEFLEEVRRRGDLTGIAEAERDARAIMTFYGLELDGAALRKLTSQLPHDLQDMLKESAARVPRSSSKAILPLEEFYDQFVQRTGDRKDVLTRVQTVMSVVRDVCGGALVDVMRALPGEYVEIVPEPGRPWPGEARV